MVYQGPSQGCQTCRKRRVKCDGSLPECNNCVKRKRACPGYRDHFDVMLKDETALTAERSRKKEKRPEERQTPEACVLDLSSALDANAELYSLCFFFSNYVTVPREAKTSIGFLEILLPMYSKVSPDSPLSMATSAVAINLASMWWHKGVDTPDATTRYAKAVALTKAALADPVQSKTDELLMTVLILEFYDSVSRRFSNRRASGTHKDGALALVEHRGSANFQSEASRRLFIAVRNRLISTAMQQKQDIFLDPVVWTDAEELPENPSTRLDMLGAELAHLQGAVAKLHPYGSSLVSPVSSPSVLSVSSEDSGGGYLIANLEALFDKALDLDRRISAWPASTPMEWQPIPITSLDEIHPTIQTAGLYSSLCDVYVSLQVAGAYNDWRGISLRMLQVIDKIRRALPANSIASLVASETYTTTRMQALVDGICASVPFHLGNHIVPSVPESFSGVEFPQLPLGRDGRRMTSFVRDDRGNITKLSQTDHKRTAASLGGPFMLFTLLRVLEAARPWPDAGPDDPAPLRLRPGQIQWILGQLKRMQCIYRIPTPSPK